MNNALYLTFLVFLQSPALGEVAQYSVLKGSSGCTISAHPVLPPLFPHYWLHGQENEVHKNPNLSPALLQNLIYLTNTDERKKIHVMFLCKIQWRSESFLLCSVTWGQLTTVSPWFLQLHCSVIRMFSSSKL